MNMDREYAIDILSSEILRCKAIRKLYESEEEYKSYVGVYDKRIDAFTILFEELEGISHDEYIRRTR